MRTRALALAPLAVAGLVAGLMVAVPQSAAADTTVVSKVGLPDGWSVTDYRLDGMPGDSTYAHVEGPGAVPTGIGSLQFDQGEHTFKLALHDSLSVDAAAADFGAFTITYRSNVTLRVTLGVVSYQVDTPVAFLPPTDTWTTVDLMAGTWALERDPHHTVVATVTWAQMLEVYPEMVLGGMSIESWADAPDIRWNIDTVEFGPTGEVTTVDFDTDPIPVLTSSTATVTLAPGGTTPLSGRVNRPSGDPIAALPVQLWQKVWGTGTWVLATTVTSTDAGTFGTHVTPAKQTYYQWRVDTTDYATATSATRRVDVKAVISANLVDATVTTTTPVVVFGKASSVLVGRTLTLRRVGSTSPLAYAKVRADSTYAFARTLPRGTWTLYVTSATADGITAGVSPQVKAVVS